MTHRTTRKKDERGAILILSTVGLVLALIAGGLAVDLGFMAHEARDNQKVADLAALDAARALPGDPTDAARESALRNGFTDVNPPNFVVETGTMTDGVFTPSGVAGATAVRVSVTTTHENQFPFLNDGQQVTRRGIATNAPKGGFSIGSSLATIDPSRSAILNRFMGGMLRGTNLSISGVSWQGLVAGNVTIEALRQQLGTMGFSVGNADELLDANMSLSQLFQATAQALTAQGPTGNAQATILNALRAQITATTLTNFKLGDFIDVAQGAEDMALSSTLNVFQLVTAGAQVANGENFINVDPVGIAVGDVVKTTASLKVVEPPRFYFGPVGGSVSTSQIELTVNPTLNVPISVLGLAGASVKNQFPLKFTGAGATGTLSDVDCAAPSTMTVTVVPSAVAGLASASLDVYANVLFVNIPVLRIPTTNVVSDAQGDPVDVRFDYPTEFPPPLGTETSEQVGSRPMGLGDILTVQPGTPVVLNAIAAPLVGSIVTSVLNALNTVVDEVDQKILTPLITALGVNIGAADVTARAMKCGTPTLVG